MNDQPTLDGEVTVTSIQTAGTFGGRNKGYVLKSQIEIVMALF